MRVDLKHPLTGPDGHKIAWLEFRRPCLDDLIATEELESLDAARSMAARLSGVPLQVVGGMDAADVPGLIKAVGEAQRPFRDAMAALYPGEADASDGESGPQS